jgi:hypothetical protein
MSWFITGTITEFTGEKLGKPRKKIKIDPTKPVSGGD